MGMPIITPGNSTCEQAVTNLIESVAMQENALSHILNAEGEKMQAIISMEDVTAGQLLSMNRSVGRQTGNDITGQGGTGRSAVQPSGRYPDRGRGRWVIVWLPYQEELYLTETEA